MKILWWLVVTHILFLSSRNICGAVVEKYDANGAMYVEEADDVEEDDVATPTSCGDFSAEDSDQQQPETTDERRKRQSDSEDLEANEAQSESLPEDSDVSSGHVEGGEMDFGADTSDQQPADGEADAERRKRQVPVQQQVLHQNGQTHHQPQYVEAVPHRPSKRLRFLDGIFGTVRQHNAPLNVDKRSIPEEYGTPDDHFSTTATVQTEPEAGAKRRRRRRATAQEREAQFLEYLDDDYSVVSQQARDQLSTPTKRVKRATASDPSFAYDIDVAEATALTAVSRLARPQKNTVDAVASEEPTVTAFDVSVPNWEATSMLVDPRGFRTAMLPAMRRSRTDFAGKVASLVNQQCLVQDAEAPLTAKDITRFANQNELAARRLADQLTNGDARDLFANMRKMNYASSSSSSSNSDDCLSDDDLDCDPKYPFRTMDGTCNNLDHPRWGSSLATQNRLVEASFADHISQPRTVSVTSRLPDNLIPLPSARQVSTSVSRNIFRPNKKGTDWLFQWSQFVAHDIVRTPSERIQDPIESTKTVSPQCCVKGDTCAISACMAIRVPDDDRFFAQFGVNCLEFARSQPFAATKCQLGARLPLNEETAFIDASHVYGFTDEQALKLRSKRKGRLRINTSPIARKQLLIMPPGGPDGVGCVAADDQRKCLDAGDSRINQHTGLVAVHTLMLRVHNWIATFLSANRPKASDDSVYLLTRKIVGAMLQHITYSELLPVLLGKAIYNDPANGVVLKKKGHAEYDDSLDPSINVEFAASAFRFHTLVGNWLPAKDQTGNFYPFYQHFNNPKMFFKEGIIDEILTGFSVDIPETFDPEFSFIFQNQIFKPVNQSFGSDMFSTNIQRGRDQGLPTYNEARKFCGLKTFNSFHDMESVMPSVSIANLASVYRNVNDVDLHVGGISELPVNKDGLVGETVACFLTQQFRRLRSGDRFWYENSGQFSTAQLKEIRKVTLAALVCHESTVTQIQKRAILQESDGNPIVDCEDILADTIQLEPFLKHLPK